MKEHRNYCLFLKGEKYNRNWGCKLHDNAYGINGGGTGEDRYQADLKLYRHMKENNDPLALLTLAGTRLFGWFFFNYHNGLWKGRLIKRFLPNY